MRAIGITRRRVFGLAAVVAVVAVGGTTAGVLVTHASSGATSSRSARAASGGAFDPSGSAPGTLATTRPARVALGTLSSHRLLIVGASYTQGLGATPQTDGYAYVVGRMLGWPTTVAGVAGTGFVNPGPHHQGTFAQRVQRLPRSLAPGLVLIQCGRNDIGYPAAEVRAAITQTVNVIDQRFPHARVVLLGSIPGEASISPAVHGIDTLLREASARASLPFIDPVREQWVTPSDIGGYSGPVAQHPNNAGYAFIARRVVADLIELGDGQITAIT